MPYTGCVTSRPTKFRSSLRDRSTETSAPTGGAPQGRRHRLHSARSVDRGLDHSEDRSPDRRSKQDLLPRAVFVRGIRGVTLSACDLEGLHRRRPRLRRVSTSVMITALATWSGVRSPRATVAARPAFQQCVAGFVRRVLAGTGRAGPRLRGGPRGIVHDRVEGPVPHQPAGSSRLPAEPVGDQRGLLGCLLLHDGGLLGQAGWCRTVLRAAIADPSSMRGAFCGRGAPAPPSPQHPPHEQELCAGLRRNKSEGPAGSGR